MAEAVYGESQLIRFYRGAERDTAGRRIADIWAWDHRRLEIVHDYIQWLFPLPEPSRFNPDAPLLTAADMAAFQSDTDLRAAMMRSLDLMLDFYGLARKDAAVARATSFAARAREWVTPNNHNFLRLTRILLCLHHTGFDVEAQSLFACLEEIADREGRGIISARTRAFWRNALRGVSTA